MAGDAELQTEGSTNGVNGAPREFRKETYEEQLARDRAAFLADDGFADDNDTTTATPKKPSKKPVEDDDSDLDEGDDQVDDEDVEDDKEASADNADFDADEEVEDDDSDLDEDDDQDDEGEKPDADTKKRMDAVRRTEQRMRAQIEREKQAWAKEREATLAKDNAERAQWKEQLAELERFNAMKARAKIDLAGVLQDAFGFTEDDFEFGAHYLYAHSKKGAEDPRRREAVARSKRERELASEVESVKKKLAEREEAEKKAAEKQQSRAQVEAYVESVVKAGSDKTPLAKKYIAANPQKARAKIEQLTLTMLHEKGEVPSPKAVMIALEKNRRAALRELGIDPRAHVTSTSSSAADAATSTAAKGGKPAAKAKAKAGGKPVQRDDQPLSFAEQKARDRQAFIDGDDN